MRRGDEMGMRSEFVELCGSLMPVALSSTAPVASTAHESLLCQFHPNCTTPISSAPVAYISGLTQAHPNHPCISIQGILA
jgi:hypothetical protein